MGFTEIWLLLITLTLVKASINSANTNQNFTLPSNCRNQTCGDIEIEYPFGIGNGCFYAAEFNLTCSYDSDPPRLLLGDSNLQVKDFDMNVPLVYIESPYVILDVDKESINTTLIDLKNLPFSMNRQFYFQQASRSTTNTNFLYVLGCNATASIVDLVTNSIVAACSSICTSNNTSTIDYGFTSGNGFCSIDLWYLKSNQTSLAIQLSRANENENENENSDMTTNITAILCTECDPLDETELERFIKRENKTRAEISLYWYINNDRRLSCKEAKNYSATYACRSPNSDCYDIFDTDGFHGYICQCPLDYYGNPYLPDGCQLDTNFTHIPAKDCPNKCGNITVPFPFGLKEKCYRSQEFALSCKESTQPPTLLYDNNFKVNAISLEDVQLELLQYDERYGLVSEKYFPSKEEHHSSCLDVNITKDDYEYSAYRCECIGGYEGNPYIDDGCQEIGPCNSSSNVCKGICTNIKGGFNCTCPLGTSGDPLNGPCIPNKKKILLLGVLVGASSGIFLLFLCITLVILNRKWNERYQKKIRQRNFHQNHGLLLQQLISTNEHVKEKTNIFPLEEIEKATNNFDETRVLGRGGHGIVYKGILSDQRVVAIKKSKTVKKSEIDQFINEIVLLSQINHRNVVKLFGCCLETEVPLLIYEFITNGALSDHLHVIQGESKLSWDDHLRIATESAGALAYLHSAASISIFHRDVKSSNILLDDTLRAKVSDFGASKFIPLDQTHIVTVIHGTLGYLDPEYYQTCQLTEKSDVYSFGVILLELLTGKKPIYLTDIGSQQNLAINFLQTTREKMPFKLIDDCILQEGTEQELLEMSSLIEMCLSLKGVQRPTMKEVEYKLQGIRKTRTKKKGPVFRKATRKQNA
ncbi:wall-associated receptor kinase 1-like [Zingiber officinale]|uniref:wall-associated receptor kinase 1-like n=1 Tax=Zingiber officinale TaxID=94328 RepID=UPI001C4CC676|nr:wall-associated receptor kinase 1-like [Zingiber officinale]